MQEGKERGLGPAAACRCSAQGIRGLGCLYRDGEGIFGLRAKRRVRWRIGLQRKEKWAGLLVWAEKVFPIFFLFAKRFNKFDLNLNSTNSNSNQTTRNKTMQSGMSANKQPHLDLEKQLIFILTKFPVKKIKY